MRTQDIFIVHPETEEQSQALTAFVNALKIKFEISAKEKPYNPDFVAKITRKEKGKYIRLKNLMHYGNNIPTGR